MLEKYKVSSPFKLSKEEKSKFFTEVKEGWAKGGKVSESSVSSGSLSWDSFSTKKKQSFLQKAFREYFTDKLKEDHEVDSPSDLTKEEKRQFFNAVKKEWPRIKRDVIKNAKGKEKKSLPTNKRKANKRKAKHHSESLDFDSVSFKRSTVHEKPAVKKAKPAIKRELSHLQKAVHAHFRGKLEKYGVDSPAKLDKETKAEFFNEVKEDWPKAKAKAVREAKKLGIEIPKARSKKKV